MRSVVVFVKLSALLTACRVSAFVHRTSGEVLFLSHADADMAEKWFPDTPLHKLRAVLENSADWLAVPRHAGEPAELQEFVVRWCGENGFAITM
jgi:hypothetical protein